MKSEKSVEEIPGSVIIKCKITERENANDKIANRKDCNRI